MRVVELWRYPVKSLQGECLDATDLDDHGFVGDRAWGLVDRETGLVLTARREPKLLLASARLVHYGEVEVVLPDGTVTTSSGELSAWLGRPVDLRRARPDERGRYETAVDAEHEDRSPWVEWEGPRGSFHDSRRTQVSIISTASLRHWPVRRFRPNVVVDGADEDDLVGERLTLGGATLDAVKRIDRCLVVARPQPAGIDADLDVLRTINRDHEGFLGIGTLVHHPGRVTVGDRLAYSGSP